MKKKNSETPPTPLKRVILGEQFHRIVSTVKWRVVNEQKYMCEGYSADTRAGKFPLVPMGGWAEGPACADTGARTPIGASGIIYRDGY